MNEPRLLIPPMDAIPWPTLGPDVADWIEENLVHGPGDVRGRPITITDEERLFLYRCYEVYPHDHELAGRRRFKRVIYSRRKGARKTELAAWIAIAEMDPSAPVRCIGWDGVMVPLGGAVTDPYIPMVATTEEQSEDLAYGAVKAILENCKLGNSYLVGEERIQHRDAPGVMKALASSPNATDGQRTTFQHFDETHLFVSERLKNTQRTMVRNVSKRALADGWSLETSTMYAPGEESVAELSHLYAEEIRAGRVDDPRLLFDHRQASETHDLETRKGLIAAITEASGDAILWADVESVASQYREASANRDEGVKNSFRRYWLNQRRSLARRAYPPDLWAERARKVHVSEGREIVVGFDGGYSRDSSALVGCTVEAVPHLFVIAVWEKPPNNPRWRTPVLEVDAEVADAMEKWNVRELACDPFGWRQEIETWKDAYGEVVEPFPTNKPVHMGPACDQFEQALRDGKFSHDGDERLARHVSHCVAKKRGPYILVTKEADDSPLKIDIAIAAIIAHNRAVYYANVPITGGVGFAFA